MILKEIVEIKSKKKLAVSTFNKSFVQKIQNCTQSLSTFLKEVK